MMRLLQAVHVLHRFVLRQLQSLSLLLAHGYTWILLALSSLLLSTATSRSVALWILALAMVVSGLAIISRPALPKLASSVSSPTYAQSKACPTPLNLKLCAQIKVPPSSLTTSVSFWRPSTCNRRVLLRVYATRAELPR